MRNTVLALSVALQWGSGHVTRKGMQEWSKAVARQFVYIHGLPQPTAELCCEAVMEECAIRSNSQILFAKSEHESSFSCLHCQSGTLATTCAAKLQHKAACPSAQDEEMSASATERRQAHSADAPSAAADSHIRYALLLQPQKNAPRGMQRKASHPELASRKHCA